MMIIGGVAAAAAGALTLFAIYRLTRN